MLNRKSNIVTYFECWSPVAIKDFQNLIKRLVDIIYEIH